MRQWNAPKGTKMYFLFGKEASEMYFNGEPLTEILRAAEDGEIEYDLFIFEQGITNPADLLHFYTQRNWGDYCVIDSKDHFEILNTAGQ